MSEPPEQPEGRLELPPGRPDIPRYQPDDEREEGGPGSGGLYYQDPYFGDVEEPTPSLHLDPPGEEASGAGNFGAGASGPPRAGQQAGRSFPDTARAWAAAHELD
ncbi:MAG TPA: hypothetical protein VKU77_39295, partial [Streptosporangiaceae bacterium]|nr:hypothetical protein [Streptosporangiaceae bacterium]